MSFASIDIVFAVLILVLAVRGAIRGFVAEFGSVAALCMAGSDGAGEDRPRTWARAA